ncbi:hypothetical protein VE25_12020, partial [Devosia geojensis]
MRRIVEERFDDIVPHSTGPVFAHDDLQPGNVLAARTPDGSLTRSGLIDFGNARAADPVFDLAKCLFCSRHEAPDSPALILEGFGPIGPWLVTRDEVADPQNLGMWLEVDGHRYQDGSTRTM